MTVDVAIIVHTVVVVEDINIYWDVILLITNTRGVRKMELLETQGTKSENQ